MCVCARARVAPSEEHVSRLSSWLQPCAVVQCVSLRLVNMAAHVSTHSFTFWLYFLYLLWVRARGQAFPGGTLRAFCRLCKRNLGSALLTRDLDRPSGAPLFQAPVSVFMLTDCSRGNREPTAAPAG